MIAIICFQSAYWIAALSLPLLVAFAFALSKLNDVPTARIAFYSGLAVGTALAASQLTFFFQVFGPGAISLWLIIGFWLGAYCAIAWCLEKRFQAWSWLMLPVVWMGLEFFRSELYYLRFSWVTPGLGLAGSVWESVLVYGHYAAGSLVVLVACLVRWTVRELGTKRTGNAGIAVASGWCLLFCIVAGITLGYSPQGTSMSGPVVAGVQLESPSVSQVLTGLDRTIDAVPEAELLLLSEYTFDGPVPDVVSDWCDANDRYLIVGGKDRRNDGQFFNTAFVVGPDGRIAYQQAKSVPIQFFDDGLPAKSQGIWRSPFGPIGLAICYDLSYSTVIDGMVRDGAGCIVNPTMDSIQWGRAEHHLHARVPRMRAIEYGIPVFRLASSRDFDFRG